ncbi:unnamed protein product [Rhodiola kirilowii]
MLKLDISKAYDSVDWSFLRQCLEIFGFPVIYINWTMACVSTVKFSVLVNGCLKGYFGSNRGLRQGDPISPYILTLIMKMLSRLLGNLKSSGSYKFHPKCARISLSHLMSADDVIVFSKANVESLVKVREALNTFHEWSGLKVNVDKSAIFWRLQCEGGKHFLLLISRKGNSLLPT